MDSDDVKHEARERLAELTKDLPPFVECEFYKVCGNRIRPRQPSCPGHLPSFLCAECKEEWFGWKARI